MSDQSRRKLLKSIAAGSGAIVAGKSLPESWSKPVVDSVILPAHAQTSPGAEPTTFTQTITQTIELTEPTVLSFDFDIGSFIPTGAGTVTVTAFADLGNYLSAPGQDNIDASENIDVSVGGTSIGILFDGADGFQCDSAVPPLSSGPTSIPVSLADLQAAISGTTITIELTPSSQVGVSCGAGDQIVTLEFPA